MQIKSREVPVDFQIRRHLNQRSYLSENDLQHYMNDEKGYEGEKRFDTILEILPDTSFLKLDDLLLDWHNTTFQIDSLLISKHKIYCFEVKNYEGEWYIDGDKWYWLSGEEKQNPVLQLERSSSLLRQLLKSLGIKVPVESYLIFVNPEFTLYQAPKQLPVILPTQINRFVKKLSMSSGKLSQAHFTLAETLASLHIEDSVFSRRRVPDYSYDGLKKGIVCEKCGSLAIKLQYQKLECQSCGCEASVEIGVKQAVDEFSLLFPERKITIASISDWCGISLSRKWLRKILKDHLTLVKNGKYSYYK